VGASEPGRIRPKGQANDAALFDLLAEWARRSTRQRSSLPIRKRCIGFRGRVISAPRGNPKYHREHSCAEETHQAAAGSAMLSGSRLRRSRSRRVAALTPTVKIIVPWQPGAANDSLVGWSPADSGAIRSQYSGGKCTGGCVSHRHQCVIHADPDGYTCRELLPTAVMPPPPLLGFFFFLGKRRDVRSAV